MGVLEQQFRIQKEGGFVYQPEEVTRDPADGSIPAGWLALYAKDGLWNMKGSDNLVETMATREFVLSQLALRKLT